MHIGWLCTALAALILLPAASAVAATPDPVLRRSEQLDIRRLGAVSEDERAVLRVEWRAAVTGGDEARTVQNMLDSLQRMEEAIGAIGRLIRSRPVQQPVVAAVVAPVAMEAPESSDFNMRLALANITAAGLVALWWFRRRNSAKTPEAKPDVKTRADASAPIAPSPVGIEPTVASITKVEPVVAAPETPPAKPTAGDLPIVQPKPAAVTPIAQALAEEQRPEPRATTEAIKAATSPAPIKAPAVEPTAPPKPAKTMQAGPLPEAANPVIDFLLEDADPAVVARENAKLKKLKIIPPPEAPAEPQDTNVEPTLQLAEIMLSMGLEQGAAQALIEYTEANPRHAVYHWLKLLGIYRSKGLHEEFKETAEKLRQHFNIQAEDTATTGIGETPTLEDFPRVAQHVQESWRQPEECLGYLQNLLEDNREGSRAGFPLAVAEEILWLIEILKADEA